MAYRNNMKLGWVGFIYPAPPEITDDMAKLEWQMQQAQRLGCEVLQPIVFHLPTDDASVDKINEMLQKYGIEYEIGCPPAVFKLAGPDAKEAREELIAQIKFAKKLGSKILRTGYNYMLAYEYSRYNHAKGMTGKDQFDSVVASLKQAAPIFEEYGVYFAQENHVDFTGKEMAQIFEEVNSPNMGIALDTANSFAIFSEPNEDNLRMAPWAITSHIKDTKVVPKTQDGDYFPLIPVGCPLGEGEIDIPAVIDAIATKSRYPEGFHLILEQGWWGDQVTGDPIEFAHNAMEKGLVYLKDLITVK